MSLLDEIRKGFAVSLAKLTSKPDEYAQMIRPTQDPKFGDYQANCAMSMQKDVAGLKPREIAQKIIDGLPDRSMYDSIEIAGPGFINLKLSSQCLIDHATKLLKDPRVGIEPDANAGTMVIDYSSPNVAKPMHVGHIRSTIIGDAIARIYRALGWKVVADNHLGDWGLQFGMLIYGWRHLKDEAAAKENPLAELSRLYQLVNRSAEADPAVAEATRKETAKLHEGDPENVALWNQFLPWCLADLQKSYDRLGIKFDHWHGESFYHPMLAKTVDLLKESGAAVESDGAICVFFPDPSGKVDDDGKPIQKFAPAIIQKKDGAFTYSTSDIACIRYRLEEFKPKLILYVVDDRQSLHFQQIFDIAAKSGLTQAELVHVAFGKIMGKDGKPYKTREGGVVALSELLDEAITRARAIVDHASEDLTEAEKQQIAQVVGIGAVKYADLCQNRTSDYIFDWDKMISLQGNTATYLQYAYARCRSIFRKGEVDSSKLAETDSKIQITNSEERALLLCMLRFQEAMVLAAADYRPNVLTNYLYELAKYYSNFFNASPVLKADTPELRESRLALCDMTSRILASGLDLLGIRTLERM